MRNFGSLIMTQPAAKDSETVQLLVVDGDKVLLVHERAEDGPVSQENLAIGNKPAGWGLPGGGVDEKRTENDIIRQILRFLPVYKIDDSYFLNIEIYDGISFKLFLTAVKEGIEETGLLIVPVMFLMEDRNSPSHKVTVIYGEVVAGEIQKRSVETDDCGWFDVGYLPYGIYRSHLRRIIGGLEALGLIEISFKVKVEEAKVAKEVV